MKRVMVLFAAAILIMLVSSTSQAATRTYDTNFGVMKLQIDGTYVSGTYSHQNGTIEGTLEGTVMTGAWHQSNGKGSCVVTFSHDFSRFDIKWNYAGETSWRGNWYGTSKGAAGIPAIPESFRRSYSTNYGDMTLNFSGDTVTGNYTHQNGKLTGTLNGNLLTGTWTQNNGSGSFVFTFADGYNSFEGKWNYRGESSLRGGWNGSHKDGGGPAITPANFIRSYGTDYGDMTLNFNGDTVTGNYTHQNGKVAGRLSGNILSGTWTQNNGSGSFVFTFGQGYNSFEGKWNYKGESSMRGGWNGKPK
ncbi:MAG: hypothetical protein HY888_07825 [Deltaproteobacteria bacterium]|nr:hypothetical protein [Deltaproteobacteria bacterium]